MTDNEEGKPILGKYNAPSEEVEIEPLYSGPTARSVVATPSGRTAACASAGPAEALLLLVSITSTCSAATCATYRQVHVERKVLLWFSGVANSEQ